MVKHHKTNPEYYEGSLSEEASRQRSDVEQRLNQVYASAKSEENPIKSVKLLRKADLIEAQLALHGANPKKVPFEDLKEHVRYPSDQDSVVNKYKGRITNRATGIRAYCISCMGGAVAEVRMCASVTCPLHPFRMGKDPFRGFELPPYVMPDFEEVEEEDDVGEFEEGDEGSEADGN